MFITGDHVGSLPAKMVIFNITVDLIWQKISIPDENRAMQLCDDKQFYLAIPGVARFLVLPEKNCIIIEKAMENISNDIINTWLLGTVASYLLQYQGYLVLHGSAVLINNNAVIISGQSGAGKSTLANALMYKGYPFITDDLVVIKRNQQGQYCVLPGPQKLKLWKDTMQHFNHDINQATPIYRKADKYAIHATNACHISMIPIVAFYELNIDAHASASHCVDLDAPQSLKVLIENAYRYFMLKPLGKLQTFFHDCCKLSQQTTVYKLIRTTQFHSLAQIIQRIELDQGINHS